MGASRQHRTLEPGDRAPDFHLDRLEGGQVALQDLTRNGPALIVFFKTTCPICQMTFPFLERIHVAGTLPIYSISQDDAEHTRKFNRDLKITIPALLDPEDDFPASNAYGINHVPTLFLIEPDGAISWMLDGWNKKEIQKLAGRAGVNPFRQGESVPEWKAG